VLQNSPSAVLVSIEAVFVFLVRFFFGYRTPGRYCWESIRSHVIWYDWWVIEFGVREVFWLMFWRQRRRRRWWWWLWYVSRACWRINID